MKVLLFQSPLGHPYRHVFPYGLCAVATALKENHVVKVLDPNVIPDYHRYIQTVMAEFRPAILGVSLRNIDTVRKNVPLLFHKSFQRFLTELKGGAPDTPIIAGGPGFSLFPREIMAACPEIDFGIRGEGEESFPELLVNMGHAESVKGVFYRHKGSVLYSGDRSPLYLSRLPRVDRSFVDMSPYTGFPYDIGVESKRGCIFNCAYCCYQHLNGYGLRLRQPGHVVDEIEELISEYGITTFSFTDSVFDAPRQHAEAICRHITERRLKINWAAWFNGKAFDEAFFFSLVKAGCNFFVFSPDGYTPRTLRGLKKHLTHADISNIYRIFRKYGHGVTVTFNFFGNSPDMGWIDFLRTLVFCIKAKLILQDRLHRAGMDHIRILPRTALYETALKKKVISNHTNLLPDNANDYERVFYFDPQRKGVGFLFQLFGSLQGRGYTLQ